MVEHPLGKGEVVGSIPTGSTTTKESAQFRLCWVLTSAQAHRNGTKMPRKAETRIKERGAVWENSGPAAPVVLGLSQNGKRRYAEPGYVDAG